MVVALALPLALFAAVDVLPHSLIELHEPEIDSIENPSPVELQVGANQPNQEHDAKQGEDKRAGVFFRLRSNIDASIYAKCANGQ